MFLFGIAIFNTVASLVKEAILMFAIGIFATGFTVENYVLLHASSIAKVRVSFIKNFMQRINELKITIGALEKLIKQQPFLYLFLRPTLKYLRGRVKLEKMIIKHNDSY